MSEDNKIIINGARVNNLKNIDVVIPRNKLIVVTGLSGSGKSSLAFDTIYAEGQRRYMETLSSYARQFIGNMERPDVESITGLSPVIAIEQKTTNKNPRSTIGTITEIYDFLRLLFAKASIAYSKNTGEKMVKYTDAQIVDLIIKQFDGEKTMILAPIVKGRKGHYRELFENLLKKGFITVRIDGKIQDIKPLMKLDRYRQHFIEIVVDKLMPSQKDEKRLSESVRVAMAQGNNTIIVLNTTTNERKYYSRSLMCPTTGISYNEPAPHSFSFNSPQGACPNCNGLGTVAEMDMDKIISDSKKSIRNGAIEPLGKGAENSMIFSKIEMILKKYKFSINDKIEDIPDDVLKLILYGSDESFRIDGIQGGASQYFVGFEGVISFINDKKYNGGEWSKNWADRFVKNIECPVCHGRRLNQETQYFKIGGKNISELTEMDITTLHNWIKNINDKLNNRQKAIAGELLKEINSRLSFLIDVGLGYLSLSRGTRTLSGGESQRIRLATQIGSKLVNVLYILDEPSIGLHQRDNIKLINSLKKLRDEGNSVIVVEHDEETIRSADFLIDMGPGAGAHGGEIIFAGSPNEITEKTETLTAKYLTKQLEIKIPEKRRPGNGKFIKLFGAKGNNLKNIDVSFPLGCFICVTGVSGSGKSSLINETLLPILSNKFYKSSESPLPYMKIEGLERENIDKVIRVDQSPIGRTPRSNPATYTKVFDEIRNLFAQIPEAKIRAYKSGRFSFNVKGGRCEECKGAGVQTLEMNFLPDVYVKCKSCNGKRYNRETLEIRYKKKDISQTLDMTIDEACEFFEKIPSIYRKLKSMKDVGLGYLKLGQQATTLSGGESQRVKLAAELAKNDTGKTLYILDEPTTGLHFEDVRILLTVLNKLVDKGNTIIVIEHNLEVVKTADYIIDMGKEGGAGGGELLCCGTPEEIVRCEKSYTAGFLKNILKVKK